eukprot:scaffold8631_cov108-Isochrysis_galbana.AAC.9
MAAHHGVGVSGETAASQMWGQGGAALSGGLLIKSWFGAEPRLNLCLRALRQAPGATQAQARVVAGHGRARAGACKQQAHTHTAAT